MTLKAFIETNLSIAEIIQIYSLDSVIRDFRNSNPEIHHQLGQLFAVDENNPLLDSVDVVLGIF